VAGHSYPPQDRRLTYPVPCHPAPAMSHPIERAPGAARGPQASPKPG
jgi:hypothetical protein